MYPKDTFSYGAVRTVFYPKHLDTQICANIVDPDQMPTNAASDLGLHCLHLIEQYLVTAAGSQMGLLKRQDIYKRVKVFEYLG